MFELKTPDFWYKDKGEKDWRITALWPAMMLYRYGHWLNITSQAPHKVDVPVLCVGNLSAGGSGKTPVALALMEIIENSGKYKKPMFLSRGYGGSIIGPALADLSIHDTDDIGDEALLLARKAPVVISTNRKAGALLAIENGADLIIMDDGHQHMSLHKDVSFVVVDGPVGFGNGLCLPAGPLRETLDVGLSRADGVILIGEDRTDAAAEIPADIPVVPAHIKVKELHATGKVLAFCGIGRPEKFFDTVRENDLDLVDSVIFPDHHSYEQSDLDELLAKAKELKATLLTTRKDMVKIKKFKGSDTVEVLSIMIGWDNLELLERTLKAKGIL